MKGIIHRMKDLHTYVMAAPASCAAVAEEWEETDMKYSTMTGALKGSLAHVEMMLRYLIEDLGGERLDAPPPGWVFGEAEDLETLAAAEVAPREDTSIAGVG